MSTRRPTSTSAVVTSTAGFALLSVHDPSSAAPGHLVNGAFSLLQPLQARARNAANPGTAYNNVGSTASPLNLLSYDRPASNDQVSLQFSQLINATHALRTGTYAKVLTFTLSTTTPCTMGTTATVTISGFVGPSMGTSPPSTSGTVSCRAYELSGFFAPIDMAEPNSAKAGKTVPVKWRVLDSDGNAVDDPDQVSIPTSAPGDCEAGAAPDAIETYTAEPWRAPIPGDGYWQYNWKTSKQWTGCRKLTLTLSDADTLKADFQFK